MGQQMGYRPDRNGGQLRVTDKAFDIRMGPSRHKKNE